MALFLLKQGVHAPSVGAQERVLLPKYGELLLEEHQTMTAGHRC